MTKIEENLIPNGKQQINLRFITWQSNFLYPFTTKYTITRHKFQFSFNESTCNDFFLFRCSKLRLAKKKTVHLCTDRCIRKCESAEVDKNLISQSRIFSHTVRDETVNPWPRLRSSELFIFERDTRCRWIFRVKEISTFVGHLPHCTRSVTSLFHPWQARGARTRCSSQPSFQDRDTGNSLRPCARPRLIIRSGTFPYTRMQDKFARRN